MSAPRKSKRKASSAKPAEVRVIDLALHGTLLPAKPGTCPECATEHEAAFPHNQQSLYWQYRFYQKSGGRWPTWDDAMAHCTPDMQAQWKVALARALDGARGAR